MKTTMKNKHTQQNGKIMKHIILCLIILTTSSAVIGSQGPTASERLRTVVTMAAYIKGKGPRLSESRKYFRQVGKLIQCFQKNKFSLKKCATTPALITMRPGKIEDVLVALLGGTVFGIRVVTDDLFGYRLPGTTNFQAGLLLQMQNLLPKGPKIDAVFKRLQDVAQGLDEVLKAVGEDLAKVLGVTLPPRPGQPPATDLPSVDLPPLSDEEAAAIIKDALDGDPAVPGSGMSEAETNALANMPE